jgi:endonuclease/exonuclease/phosphatase (EEP) superfamily protein YafD
LAQRPVTFGAVLFLLGGLAAVYRTVSDAATWSECLTVWPPLVWCVLVVPRLLLLVARGRRREAAASFALVLGFLAVTMEWPRGVGNNPAPTPGAATLRVVSWNVAGRVPMDRLRELAPDVCMLQEIGHVPADRLRGFWAGWHWQETFDPGLLSRFPVVRLASRRVGPWMEPQVARLDLPGGRRLLVMNARLMLPSLLVTAASAAPSFRALRETHDQRLAQFVGVVGLLKETLAREHLRSAILCGDFNTPGGMRSLEPLRAVLEDVWPRSGHGWGGTMTERWPVSRIDQCWVTPDIRPLSAHVVRGPSDHRALVVDLELPE